MTHDNPTLHDQGKKLKHEGWKDQVEGTMKKVGGDLTDDKGMHAKGVVQKKMGNAESKTGKFVEDVTE